LTQDDAAPLATLPDFDDPDLTAALGKRLKRMLLHELQTGGGMTLQNIVGKSVAPGSVSDHASAIRDAVGRLKKLRDGASGRAMQLLCATGSPSRVLDLGAGLAPWSLAIASTSDAMQIVAVDLPERIPDLVRAVNRAGRSGQFEFAALDFFTQEIDISKLFDLVLIANVCHLFAGRRCQQLLRVGARALHPGGMLAVIDQVLDDNPDWNRWSALYAVGASHWGPGGHLHTIGEYSTWLQEVGLINIRVHELCPPPALTLLVAYL